MAAIYQWFQGDEFLLTSPMYPIELEDGLSHNSLPSRVRIVGAHIEDALQQTSIPVSVYQKYIFNTTNAEDALEQYTLPARTAFNTEVYIEANTEDALSQISTPARTTFENGLIVALAEDALITTTTAPARTTFT